MGRRRPSLVVIAGPNGSGKTTLTEQLRPHEWLRGHEYINADDIAQQELGDWNSPEAVRRAADLAEKRRQGCLAAGRDFAFETVFSTVDKVQFLDRAKAAGFFVRLYFVGTADPQINVGRVAARVAGGGHGVPTEKIVARYYRSMNNLVAALPVVDRGYVYDNSVDGLPVKRWFRTRDGRVAREHVGEPPEWVRQAKLSLEIDRWGDDLLERE